MYSRLVLELIHLHCTSLSREEATSPGKSAVQEGTGSQEGTGRLRPHYAERRNLSDLAPYEASQNAKSSGWKKTLKVRKVGDKSVDGKKGRVDGKKW